MNVHLNSTHKMTGRSDLMVYVNSTDQQGNQKQKNKLRVWTGKPCHLCGRVFRSEDDRALHVALHDCMKFKCPAPCGNLFLDFRSFRDHNRGKHHKRVHPDQRGIYRIPQVFEKETEEEQNDVELGQATSLERESGEAEGNGGTEKLTMTSGLTGLGSCHRPATLNDTAFSLKELDVVSPKPRSGTQSGLDTSNAASESKDIDLGEHLRNEPPEIDAGDGEQQTADQDTTPDLDELDSAILESVLGGGDFQNSQFLESLEVQTWTEANHQHHDHQKRQDTVPDNSESLSELTAVGHDTTSEDDETNSATVPESDTSTLVRILPDKDQEPSSTNKSNTDNRLGEVDVVVEISDDEEDELRSSVVALLPDVGEKTEARADNSSDNASRPKLSSRAAGSCTGVRSGTLSDDDTEFYTGIMVNSLAKMKASTRDFAKIKIQTMIYNLQHNVTLQTALDLPTTDASDYEDDDANE